MRIYEVLQHIYGMMMTLEVCGKPPLLYIEKCFLFNQLNQSQDAIDPISALRFYTDPVEGRRQVRRYIKRFATRTRTELGEDIVGDDLSSIAASAATATMEDSSYFTGSLAAEVILTPEQTVSLASSTHAHVYKS